MATVNETGSYANITADTQVFTGTGKLLGIWCSSASNAPTVKVWDNTAASGRYVANTFTPIGGTFYPLPANIGVGLLVDIGGTVDLTVFFQN